MSDEPSLPRLPSRARELQSQSLEQNPRKRAIDRINAEPQSTYNSSDPAVFSSDDDPGLDNYVDGRRKRRYKGTWFRQLPMSGDSTFGDDDKAPKAQTKRTLARQYDSGIYMGSDATEDDDLADKIPPPLQPKLPQLQRKAIPPRRIDPQDLAVQEKIRSALEQGTEVIDLWSMGLTELSNDVMGLLSQFSCIPTVTKEVAFEQKEPQMRLYIAKNLLTRVPGAIFDIKHLTMLSLRGNKLTELPSGIAKLVNLKELNVSQNRLRYLPVELLDLLPHNLRSLIVWPNPFWQPTIKEEDVVEQPSSASPTMIDPSEILRAVADPRLDSNRLASSGIQITTSGGIILSEFRLPSITKGGLVKIPIEMNRPSKSGHASSISHLRASRVPSLMEAALMACYKTSDLDSMPAVIPPELSHLGDMLERASRQKYIGGHVCSKCRKTIIQSTFEWIEWREIQSARQVITREGDIPREFTVSESRSPEEMAVPFLHRGCSDLCGPTVEKVSEETAWLLQSIR